VEEEVETLKDKDLKEELLFLVLLNTKA